MSIRTRLIAILLVGLLVALVVGGTGLHLLTKRSLVHQLDAGLEARARAMATLVSIEHGRVEMEYDDELSNPATAYLFELRSAAGTLIEHADRLGDMTLPFRTASVPVFFGLALPDGRPGRAVSLAFRVRDEDEDHVDEGMAYGGIGQELIITVAVSRGSVDGALAAVLGAQLAIGVGLVVVVAGLVWFGIRVGLQPLDHLAIGLGEVTGERLSRRFEPVGAPREIVPVYDALNRMLDRIEDTVQRERRFADAAAHELRTPLAELRSTAEVALKWPDPQRAVAAMEEVLGIGGEMEGLVESLLTLSRARGDNGGQSTGRTRLAPMVSRCLERAADMIEARCLDVRVEIDERAEAPAATEALEIIVRNLVENAVEYTPEGGSIFVHADQGDAGAFTFTVENGPVDLQREDLSRLFEPLWRADGSRTDRRHAGLGLTIARHLAESIGLVVRAELDEGRTLAVAVASGATA